MQVTGTIKLIFDEYVKPNAKLTTRQFVVDIDEDNQPITFELFNSKCKFLNAFKVGDRINVFFNIRGREVTIHEKTKYFNSLQAWRIEKLKIKQYDNIRID